MGRISRSSASRLDRRPGRGRAAPRRRAPRSPPASPPGTPARRGAARSRGRCAWPGIRMSAKWTLVPSSNRAAAQHQPNAHQSRTPHEWSRWPCPSTDQSLTAHGDLPGDQAGHLVAGGHPVVVRDAVGGPGEVEGQGGRSAGLPAVDGGRIGRAPRPARCRPRSSPPAVRPPSPPRRSRRYPSTNPVPPATGRSKATDETSGRSAPTIIGRPPCHAQVGIEPDADVTGHCPVPGHEVEVVRLVPQRLGSGRVPLLVGGVDQMVAGIEAPAVTQTGVASAARAGTWPHRRQ